MKTWMCKFKSREQMEKDIPRDQWGWWIDVCPGQTLELRKATQADLERCGSITASPDEYLCEVPEWGALVRKSAIESVEMPVEAI